MASIRNHRGTVVDVFSVVLVGFVVLCYALFGKAYRRGFFCDDESIRLPYLQETVSTTVLIVVSFCTPIILVVIVEGLRLFDSSTPRDSYKSVGCRLMRSCYNVLGVFIFGAGLNQVTVDTAKYLVGRMRPHFYTVCMPSFSTTSDCASLPRYQYITDYECTGDADIVEEARLSFPSGHSALAFYTAIYISVFLHHRFLWQKSVLFRHLLQGALMFLAWYAALSRVHDNMHHPTDVLAGSVIGSFWALFVTNFVVNLKVHSSQEDIRIVRQSQIANHNQQGPNYV